MTIHDIDRFFTQIHHNLDHCLQNPGSFTNDDREPHCLSPKQLLSPQEARVTHLFETSYSTLPHPQFDSDPEGFSMWQERPIKGFKITCFPPGWSSEIVYKCIGEYNYYPEYEDPTYELIEYVNGSFSETYRTAVIWNDKNLPLASHFTRHEYIRLLTTQETIQAIAIPLIALGCVKWGIDVLTQVIEKEQYSFLQFPPLIMATRITVIAVVSTFTLLSCMAVSVTGFVLSRHTFTKNGLMHIYVNY